MSPRPSRGHSLLELIIALAVISTTLIIASEMLLARERQLARAVRVANRVSAEQALRLLRRDLRAAHSALGATSAVATWRETPLTLTAADGVMITWSREEQLLVRARSDPAGTSGTRTMLDRVSSFRWRWSPPLGIQMPMIEVELAFDPGPPVIGTGAQGVRPRVTAKRRVKVALRSAGAQAW